MIVHESCVHQSSGTATRERTCKCFSRRYLPVIHVTGVLRGKYLRNCGSTQMCNGIKRFLYYGDIMTWERFPHNWPFVPGLHRSPFSLQRVTNAKFGWFLCSCPEWAVEQTSPPACDPSNMLRMWCHGNKESCECNIWYLAMSTTIYHVTSSCHICCRSENI